MKRILSGIQSSGDLTLGNYFGACKNLLKLQEDSNNELFVFIADMHAITTYKDKSLLKKSIFNLAKLYLAFGLDPKRTHLFLQSDVLEHNQLAWILECNSYVGELERMTQYKDKKQKQVDGVTTGLLTYPVLMSADILLYDANLVPVGVDQKQHLELARNIATRFNNKYGDTFVIPEPYISSVSAKIMSLQEPDKKMSKSTNNLKGTIFLLDDINISCKKIKSAVTDSIGVINLDKENQPGIYNLLTIYASLNDLSLEDSYQKFKDYNYKDFKEEVGNSLNLFLTDLHAKFESISDSYVYEVLKEGSSIARSIASKKLNKVKKKIGLYF